MNSTLNAIRNHPCVERLVSSSRTARRLRNRLSGHHTCTGLRMRRLFATAVLIAARTACRITAPRRDCPAAYFNALRSIIRPPPILSFTRVASDRNNTFRRGSVAKPNISFHHWAISGNAIGSRFSKLSQLSWVKIIRPASASSACHALPAEMRFERSHTGTKAGWKIFNAR